MSGRDRRKRRMKKAGIAKVKREHTDTMATRYYRTLVKRDCRCSACGRKLRSRPASGRPRDEVVYRRLGPVTLCVPCADKDPLVDYRTSESWERREQRRRARRRATVPTSKQV
jgi:hypothetical protein